MVQSRGGEIWCGDERRSGVLAAPSHPLNGLDFVEFRRDPAALPGRQFALDVTFLKTPLPVPALTAADFAVIGGVRIVGIRVLDVEPDASAPLRLTVFVDREGDFSTYVLAATHGGLDEERAQARFSFKATCPSDFDCLQEVDCPEPRLDEPALDTLAKDYQSFRRLMVDLIAERNPGWQERLPADLGMTLVELLAYAGDYLSYAQDAGAVTEGTLDTCLHRVSAARHARLVDYDMHDGRNAFGFVQFGLTAGTDGVVPAGTKLLTRVGTPLVGEQSPPASVIAFPAGFETDPALADVTVFETTALLEARAEHNAMRLHTWGDSQCCLAKGAREAWLYLMSGPEGAEVAERPQLQAGDYLLLEEVASPVTGAPADADPARRQVVRLIEVEDTEDAAFTDQVPGGVLSPRASIADPALPLQRVLWREEDALGFVLCLSAETPEAGPIDPVALARGNVAPADHGRTVVRDLPPPSGGAGRWPLPSLDLADGPLTFQAMPEEARYDAEGRLLHGRHDLEGDAAEAGPAIVLNLSFPGGVVELWQAVPHLLDSGTYDQHFVAEIDDDGEAHLRFGDDHYGRRPLGATGTRARFRLGNGRAGNIGAGSLVHAVAPDPADPLDPANPGAALSFADIARVYQPLPARQGSDPETIEETRHRAPAAFRAVQFRAVTEHDWEEAALRHESVAAAKARFRWTGSWHTVFVAIQPKEEEDLERLAGGGVRLAPDYAAAITAHLVPFKLAGYDLRVRAATYVPLEIEIRICVKRGHFRGDVLEEVQRVLSNRAFADGSRGFFHLLEFSFGEAVYLSRIYAAVDGVEGVDSAEVLVFKRYWEVAVDELDRGVIAMGDFEIPRLDNDRNFPEFGVLRLQAVGGL